MIPLPIGDGNELPYELVAIICTYTVLPYCKKYGAANNTEYGILQLSCYTIVDIDPSQYVSYCENIPLNYCMRIV